MGVGDGFWEGEGVAFAALHGEAEADLVCESGGVDPSGEDDGFGFVGFSGFGCDALDFSVFGGEFCDFTGDELASVF